MTVSYPDAAQSVNLSPSAVSFYRWIARWHAQTGDVSPSTAYLARKQGKTERTVYRWLAQLRDAGMIAEEVVCGVSRAIVPLAPPPPRTRKSSCAREQVIRGRKHSVSNTTRLYETAPKMSEAMSGVHVTGRVRGLPVDAHTQETQQTQAAPVVASLAQEGITETTAAQLVAEAGPEEARKQLEALPYRKAKDRAAVLVASIRGRWDVPRAFVEALERKQREAQDAQRRALAAALDQKRAEQRAQVETALSGLSEAAYAALEARARAALAGNVAWRMAQGRAGGVAADKLLRAKMLDLAAAAS